ncbi:MAG: hypothetical protein ACM32O_08700 [Clostridia bacterium]
MKKSKWLKWKIGGGVVFSLALLMQTVKADPAFEKAHEAAMQNGDAEDEIETAANDPVMDDWKNESNEQAAATAVPFTSKPMPADTVSSDPLPPQTGKQDESKNQVQAAAHTAEAAPHPASEGASKSGQAKATVKSKPKATVKSTKTTPSSKSKKSSTAVATSKPNSSKSTVAPTSKPAPVSEPAQPPADYAAAAPAPIAEAPSDVTPTAPADSVQSPDSSSTSDSADTQEQPVKKKKSHTKSRHS